MGNGDGTEKTAVSVECDVGLGLRTQRTESFPSPYHHHHHQQQQQQHNNPYSDHSGMGCAVGDGGPMYCNLSNQVACLSDTNDVVVGAGSVSGIAAPKTLQLHNPFTTDYPFKFSGGGGSMSAPAKFPFTVSQWQELERQTTIFYKYMMASVPIPPELLIPISNTPSSLLPSNSQSNMSGLDLKFSRNSDPEPWRCRRTDGKKWRCSRDVAPYQKYCERHAHKSRPRSRKPVESQPQNTQNTTFSSSNNLNTTRPLVNLPSNNTSAQAFQNPSFHIPTMVSTTTYDQPRCTEWFMKGDPILGPTLNQQQWQQLMQSTSSREGLKKYSEEHNKNVSGFQQHFGGEQGSMNLNSYVDMGDNQRLQNQLPNDQCCSFIGPKIGFSQGGINTDQTNTTTRHFIDAWSSADGQEMNEISKRCRSVSSNEKLLISSLTLSMSGGNGIDEDQSCENAQMGLGMIDHPERESSGGFKSHCQWLNPAQWMGVSPPGGPLGEALCLGIASTGKASSNVPPSPHGCSNSTATSSCSKSSCEDSGRGLHFH